ncbi:hypothetical protein EPUS_05154 [Endocarpon pusillum Z07020]|uniref:BTB domain-containing protein n=1 Tax=Endocarpon pusillum (strain Z07020 / HMAS-L-300199) TaxID=1263415 RepID=U1GSH3_ENDPU|nr:uncharacterized protein EPUS_05154 [Endocarpon pusillum Z07020]ERF74946.1 hypothetical protein EPUS_05154 [Endocarpon pusillum Z07020]
MAGAGRSDDIDSDGTLRDILADLVSTQVESSTRSPPPQADSSWILPPYSPLPPHAASNSPRLPPSPMPRTSSASRPAQQQIAASTSHLPAPSPASDTTPQSSLFNTPSRSIFSSGPPTASVSANTAQASLSSAGPSSSSRPLAALSATNAGSSRRNPSRSSDPPPVPVPIRRRNLQKDVDDPSTTQFTTNDSPQNNTSTTLSKLFAADNGTPQSMSRDVSYFRSLSSPKSYGDVSTLSGHLLQRGLLDGRYSDITIHAFGSSYRLHRLLLDRVPFFSSAFSGPWAESSAREMTLHPEDIDSNITKAAFELALKRVYGCYLPADEEQEAVGLFATSCWLDMSNMVDSSVDILLRQMQPSKLDSLIKLVTSNYYGKAGDRILASAKAMLCREGWEMAYEYWDNIPSEIVREVVGGDPFFVPGEWERWYLALRLLNRRLKARAIEAGLISASGRYLQPKPTTLNFFAVRFDTTYRRDLMISGRGSADKDESWIGLYTSPDIAPLLVLLDEGIHYVHLRFEQLQRIRQQKDIFAVPVLPEKVISDALWMSMELRQRVVNSQEGEMELGLSKEAEQQDEEEYHSSREVECSSRKGKQPESHMQQELEMESGSWDGNGRPRKFWIPTSDSSSVMGGASETYLTATSNGGSGWSPHMSRLSASLEPADVQWAMDFTASGGDGPPGTSHSNHNDRSSIPRYSHYPPFRFSAEFPNPRTLKEKKRVYSQTVWYAGSMWNLYIQRVNTSKNQQLGIYLHRAKDKEPSDDPLALLASATVDDRIGHLEREMLMRRNNERRHQSWRSSNTTVGPEGEMEDDVSVSGDNDASLVGEVESAARRDGGMSGRPVTLARAQKTSQTPDSGAPASLSQRQAASHVIDSEEEDEERFKTGKKFNVSAMPPYVDARPTIKTYFKIYSPSRAGRMLSVYESAPDKFNFSQSWGWKSSQMVLEDGITGLDGMAKSGKDGKLRYMVVIGNV